jgi:hypothetical protein
MHKKNSNPALILLVLAGIAFSVLVFLGIAAVVVLPAVQEARESARRQTVVNELKQLSAALRNYNQAYANPQWKFNADEDRSGGSKPENSSRFVECQAILADYEERYPWFDFWTENGQEFHDNGISPRALFVITQPVEFADRKVAVLLKDGGSTLDMIPGKPDQDMMFKVELPAEFLAGS